MSRAVEPDVVETGTLDVVDGEAATGSTDAPGRPRSSALVAVDATAAGEAGEAVGDAAGDAVILSRAAIRHVMPDVTATSIVAAMATVRTETVRAVRVCVAAAEMGITAVSRRDSIPLQRSRDGAIPGSACACVTSAWSSRTSAAQRAHAD